jgi:hypothetical protein
MRRQHGKGTGVRREVARPPLVWVISIVVGLAAATQIALLTSLFVADSSGATVRALRASLPTSDWLTLYVLAFVLLASMVWFFRMRKRAVSWFGAYIGFGSLAAFGWSGAPQPHFDELVALGGLLVALAIYVYMLRLRKRDKLV